MTARVPRPAVVARLSAVALALAFVGWSAPAGRADEPPPATVPAPTTPVPDPAPASPKPAPRTAAKPAPRVVYPSAPAPAPVYRVPSSAPVAVHPAQQPRPGLHRAKRKPKRGEERQSPAPAGRLRDVAFEPTVGAVKGRGDMALRSPQATTGLVPLLVFLSLGVAIACLSTAVVPATSVKWRPAAIFVAERQFGLTVVGFTLLAAAALTIFATNGG